MASKVERATNKRKERNSTYKWDDSRRQRFVMAHLNCSFEPSDSHTGQNTAFQV